MITRLSYLTQAIWFAAAPPQSRGRYQNRRQEVGFPCILLYMESKTQTKSYTIIRVFFLVALFLS